MIKKIPWRTGYIVLNYSTDRLSISALNNMIELKPRTIVINETSGYSEGCVRKRYVYIYFSEELKPYSCRDEVLFKENNVDFYETIYTKIDYDEYYTIILPSHFLYEYVVLTSDELAVTMSTKKSVFYEKVNSKLVVYVV